MKTHRGFSLRTVTDPRGCVVRIQESSAACHRCVWIFTDDPNGVYRDGKPAPHLNAAQARRVAKALLAFADGAL